MNPLPSLNAQPALPAAARPAAPATPPRGGPGFAQALGRAREGTPTARDEAAAAGRDDATAPEEARGRRTDDPRGDGTGEASAAPATPADAGDAARPRARPVAGGPGLDEAARGAGAPLDAAAAESASASAEAAAGGAPFDGAPRGTPALPAPGRGAAGPRGSALAAEQLRAGAAADPSSGAAPEAAGTASHGGFTAALRSASMAGTGAGAESPVSPVSPASPALAGAPAAGALGASGPLPAASAAAPPAEAGVAARPGSAAFTGELSARLVTFVREGVEHGRLHLNPAEMGPVEVRIRIDGDAARVVLAADQAPTRQWLEQALPSLAAGLREAGLTLAGGGVFERGAGGGDGGRAPEGGRGSARGDAAEAGLEPAAVREPALPRRRGVVDLVA